jgi:hypothetical protein
MSDSPNHTISKATIDVVGVHGRDGIFVNPYGSLLENVLEKALETGKDFQLIIEARTIMPSINRTDRCQCGSLVNEGDFVEVKNDAIIQCPKCVERDANHKPAA